MVRQQYDSNQGRVFPDRNLLPTALRSFSKGFQILFSKQVLFQLQACCNLSSVKIWYLIASGNWSLGALAHEKVFSNSLASIWTDLQVTICDDKPEPTLGYAEARDGVNCTHHRGYTTNIQPG